MTKSFGLLTGISLVACAMGAQASHAGSIPRLVPPAFPAQGASLETLQGPALLPPSTRTPALHCKPAPCTFRNVLASGHRVNFIFHKQMPVDETPIAADPNDPDNLISGANDYNCTVPLLNTQDIPPPVSGFYISNDGGRHWKDECDFLAPGTDAGIGDPILGYDLKGTVYRGQIFNVGGTGQWVIGLGRSSDHGMTWGAPVVTTQIANQSADKPWFAADNNPNSPYVNALYVSSTLFDSSSDTTIYVSRSSDGGTTWTSVAASPVVPGPGEVEASDMAIAADGTVYLAYFYCAPPKGSQNCAGGTTTEYLQKSKDGGATWSTPVTIATASIGNKCPYTYYWPCIPHTSERVIDYPSIAIDNSNGTYSGRLYVVFWNWTGSFMQVLLTASSDGGNTWSTPVPVAPQSDTHDQFMPWLDVSSSGLVGVTWLDRRNDPDNRDYEAFAAVSGDGGATFPNYQLATAPSNPKHDGFKGGFLGDYRGSVWAGPRKLFAAWPDTRNGHRSVDEVGGLKD